MKNILNRLSNYATFSREEARAVLFDVANGVYNENQVASLITAYLMRNITLDELSGFADALMEMRLVIDFDGIETIDIVGTGGDGKDTFNISTCSAFVVAAAGYPVAKHGNYGTSSVSGASNVLEENGVKFSANSDALRRSLEQCNMAYLHAPLFNPAMKAVAGVRRSLGVRSFFNVLGPLVNPSNPTYQLLGVYNLSLLRLYTYMFQSRVKNFAVVHALDGYDEISLTSDFKISTAQNERIYSPENLGFARCEESDLFGGKTTQEAAQIFRNVLEGVATDAQTNVVTANAAFAINVVQPQKSIEECISEAKESLESKCALATFKKFIELNS